MCRGNQTLRRVDRHIVESSIGPRRPDCAAARDLVSAATDGEVSGPDRLALDAHLAGCEACRMYAERLAALTRSVRLRPAVADPAAVGRVMAAVEPIRLGRGRWTRPALAWVGLVVAAQAFAPLVLGQLQDAPTHVARHVGASALALAIAFVVVAWRPSHAQGLLPYAVALGATMTLGTVVDLAAGDRSVLAESTHVAELVGLVLLWMVAGSPGIDRLRRRHVTGRAVAPTTS